MIVRPMPAEDVLLSETAAFDKQTRHGSTQRLAAVDFCKQELARRIDFEKHKFPVRLFTHIDAVLGVQSRSFERALLAHYR
jgi:hypothetical protein